MPGVELDRDIGLIYDAAVDFTLWPEALRGIAETTGATMSAIGMRDLASGLGSVTTIGVDDAVVRQIMSYPSVEANPLRLLAGSAPVGQLMPDYKIVPRDTYIRSQVYQETLRPAGIHAATNAVLWRGGGTYCLFNLTRSRASGDFTDAELARAGQLVPHLVRAAGIALRLSAIDIRSTGAVEAASRLTCGLIMLDQRGKICFANPAAEAILALRDGLSASPIGLAAARPADTARLARAIAAAAEPGGAGSALRLERPSERRPLALHITPFRLESSWLHLSPPAVLVLIVDPDRDRMPSEQHLAQLYGLTPAEAGVAVHLAKGEDLAEIARTRRISVPTVRVHLRQIFAKTDTNRQPELIRRLLLEGLPVS